MARLGLLILLTLAPGCFFDPQLGSGRIACSVDATCPSGQVCGGDDRCHVPGPKLRMHVMIEPAGAGRVVSTPAGFDCEVADCSADMPTNVPIRLTVSSSPDYRFDSFSGCNAVFGIDSLACDLELAADSSGDVRVRFTALGGRTLWARGFGGDGLDESYAIATSPPSSVIPGQVRVVGGFDSAGFSLGPGFDVANHAADLDDALLTGFSLADGTTTLARGFGGGGFDNFWHVAMDVEGRTIVAGYFEATVDFGGGAHTIPKGYDPVVAVYDTDGGFAWDHVFGCAGITEDEAQAVTSDRNGDVFVTGVFAHACDLGDGVIRDGLEGSPFVAKLSVTNGRTLWARHFPATGGGTGEGLRVSVGTSGDVAVAGAFRVALEDPTGGTALESAGLEDVFVMRLNGVNGATIWRRRFGGPGDDRANSLAADADDNVYVTGTFQGAMPVGGALLQSVGLGDVFVFKLSGSGDPAWSHGLGGEGDDDGYGLAIDFNHDDLLVAGGMNGTVDFGNGFVLTSRARDGFVARFGIDGSGPALVRRFGGDDDDTLFDVAVDLGAGNPVVVVGSFRGTVDFGRPDAVLTSNGEDDTFVLALSP